MPRVLITGKNSYIGISLETHLKKAGYTYKVETINVKDNTWMKVDFSSYDIIVHVAGIAHQKETKASAQLYYQVNTNLAYQIAKKAANEGIKQFIFLSSMSVYGVQVGVINKDTPLTPKTHYGKSKLQAERLIQTLENETFKVAILRPPMVYGKGCKGNYDKLRKLAKLCFVFPDIQNQRSMIYIEHLNECIKMIIDNKDKGLFFPQNREFVKTSNMFYLIRQINNKPIKMITYFNSLIVNLKISTLQKLFGSLVYEPALCCYKQTYCKLDFIQTMYMTEKGGVDDG